MEKRESRRQKTLEWKDLYANARVGTQRFKLPIMDISIGGMGVLITDGFSLLQEGTEILIETMERQGLVIATSIHGRIAYLGPGVPSRAGIDFSPQDTPIEAFTELHKDTNVERLITDRLEIECIFTEIKKWSRGFGDMLMIHRHKAIPAEFFYLRPQENNMVLRIVRLSEFRLPFQPEIGKTYPFYLFKGVNVMLFHSEILDKVKNIMETSWPENLRHISRRSVLRYLVTGQQPLTARILHPISMEHTAVIVWDISIEGMGAELLMEDTPFIEGMHLPSIRIDLPAGTVEVSGVVRSVRNEDILHKTQLGIEFTEGSAHWQDRILDFILQSDFPSEAILNGS